MSRTKKKDMRVYRLGSRTNAQGLQEYYFTSARCKQCSETSDEAYVTLLERAERLGSVGGVIYLDDSIYSLDPEKLKANVLRRLSSDASNYMQALATNRKQWNQLKTLKPEVTNEPSTVTA
jgi:hypothetical protein